jgi:hypothetical protein
LGFVYILGLGNLGFDGWRIGFDDGIWGAKGWRDEGMADKRRKERLT